MLWHVDKSSQSWFDIFIVTVIEMKKSDRPLPPGERRLSPNRISRMSALLSALNPSASQHLSPPANQRRVQEVTWQLVSHLRHQRHSSIKTKTPQVQLCLPTNLMQFILHLLHSETECSDPSNRLRILFTHKSIITYYTFKSVSDFNKVLNFWTLFVV